MTCHFCGLLEIAGGGVTNQKNDLKAQGHCHVQSRMESNWSRVTP